MKRLKDNSDVPEARLGILLKTFTSFFFCPIKTFPCCKSSKYFFVAKWREERKVRRQRGGRGAGTLAGEPSASGRVSKRTHRVVQRIGKVHERVDRVLQSSLSQTRVSREKATDATLSKSTRKRNTSSCQEPDRSREEWPVPAGTVMAECKAVTA